MFFLFNSSVGFAGDRRSLKRLSPTELNIELIMGGGVRLGHWDTRLGGTRCRPKCRVLRSTMRGRIRNGRVGSRRQLTGTI